jgi:hypothetical protein
MRYDLLPLRGMRQGGRSVCMYTACKPRTGMGWGGKAGAYRTCSRDDDDGEDKNNNILVVARAKRACLGVAEHHHHRARSFIGPASSLLDQAWHVSVISRRNPPPRAVSSSKHSSHHHTHTHPPPSTRKHHLSVCCPRPPCPGLHYCRPPYLLLDLPVLPARTGVSWSLRLTRCLPCRIA